MAEGNATIHATSCLLLELADLHVMVEFVPILDSFDSGAVERELAQVFDKAGRFAHRND